MSLATLDGHPPPLFKQGPSAFSKLVCFSALALFLMVADLRFGVMRPLRSIMVTVLYPAQWAVLQPARALQIIGGYLTSLEFAQAEVAQARKKLISQATRAGQVEQLTQENARLRQLLQLREQFKTSAIAAQVLYDAADVYTRKVIIDKGSTHGVELGSGVIDESGVLGQITRVHPFISEVTLVIDRDLAVPVLNARTGVRSLAYGDPSGYGGIELRFMASSADMQVGDLLTSSGIDGVYPAGLHVAKIDKIERRADSTFARVYCKPLALVLGAKHLIVIKPVTSQMPARSSVASNAPSPLAPSVSVK